MVMMLQQRRIRRLLHASRPLRCASSKRWSFCLCLLSISSQTVDWNIRGVLVKGMPNLRRIEDGHAVPPSSVRHICAIHCAVQFTRVRVVCTSFISTSNVVLHRYVLDFSVFCRCRGLLAVSVLIRIADRRSCFFSYVPIRVQAITAKVL